MRRGTWRRQSGAVFAALVLGTIVAEIAITTMLTWTFAGQALGRSGGLPVEALVIGAIATGAMALLALTVYLLGFHVVGERRLRRRESEIEVWTETWVTLLFGQGDYPRGPLSRSAEDALIGLLESMEGAEAHRLRQLIALYGIDERLMSSLSSGDARERREAFDGLAMARLPQTLDTLIACMGDHRVELSMMASRAAARTIGALRAGPARDEASLRFADALLASQPPRGLFEEMLLLTDDAAGPIERYLLGHPNLIARLIAPVIDAASRSDETGLFDLVLGFSSSEDPEVRAAVLRYLSRMDIVPVAGRTLTIDALHDEVEFVRVNATRAARKGLATEMVPQLWECLGDDSWWVRKGAAESLAAMGPEGELALIDAVANHPDRYGRDMAGQAMVDAGISLPDDGAVTAWAGSP